MRAEHGEDCAKFPKHAGLIIACDVWSGKPRQLSLETLESASDRLILPQAAIIDADGDATPEQTFGLAIELRRQGGIYRRRLAIRCRFTLEPFSVAASLSLVRAGPL